MGLLDDAIREHLELKRQHGGDPSEIERQEQEAFGPGGRRTAPAEDAAAPDEDATAIHALPDEPVEPVEAPEPADETVVSPPDEAVASPDEVIVDDALDPPGEAIDPPADAEVEAIAPGREEDPWLVEETAEHVVEPEAEEDVLEETPEHERLWFEQRPPRDFDWDK